MDDHHKVKAINRNMEADEAAAAAAAAAGGAAFESGSSQSLLADLLSSSSSTLGDDLGISTVATFVLFGASTFAAVGMFSKTWMLEDYRGVCVCVFTRTCIPCSCPAECGVCDISFASYTHALSASAYLSF